MSSRNTTLGSSTTKVRLVLISDTHNQTPKLPPGDILIHAGDLTNQGTYGEIAKTVRWLESTEYQAKIVIAGNHDVMLDETLYAGHEAGVRDSLYEEVEKCRKLLSKGLRDGERVKEATEAEGNPNSRLSSNVPIQYLEHESTTVEITPGLWLMAENAKKQQKQQQTQQLAQQPDRSNAMTPTQAHEPPPRQDSRYLPRIRLKIFGSPYSPRIGGKGKFNAFSYDPVDTSLLSSSSTPCRATSIWEAIPLDTDIVVTHTPARYHLDERTEGNAEGCEALRRAITRARPRVHVCGHVHEGRGMEIIEWRSVQEVMTRSRSVGPNELDKDCMGVCVARWNDPGKGSKKLSRWNLSRGGGRPLRYERIFCDSGNMMQDEDRKESDCSQTEFGNVPAEILGASDQYKAAVKLTDDLPGGEVSWKIDPSSTSKDDGESFLGRVERTETCFVNASIMARSFPHKHGKELNKPIVLEIDVPIINE